MKYLFFFLVGLIYPNLFAHEKGWEPEGYTLPGHPRYIVHDGQEGFYIAYSDSGGARIQHINKYGELTWPNDVVARASDEPEDSTYYEIIRITADETRGLFVSYYETNNGSIGYQYVNDAGQTVWKRKIIDERAYRAYEFNGFFLYKKSDTVWAVAVDYMGEIVWGAEVIETLAFSERLQQSWYVKGITGDKNNTYAICVLSETSMISLEPLRERRSNMGQMVHFDHRNGGTCNITNIYYSSWTSEQDASLYMKYATSPVSDGAGGAYFLVQEEDGGLFHINNVGNVNQVCNINQIIDSSLAYHQTANWEIVHQSGNTFVAWGFDADSYHSHLYVQKIDVTGKSQWNYGGLLMTEKYANSTGTNRAMASDNAGGLYIAWSDETNGNANPNIYMQHIDAAGHYEWEKKYPVRDDIESDLRYPNMISDNDGGLLISWINFDPDKTSGNAQYMVADASSVQKASLTLISPNGGERFISLSKYTISWTSRFFASKVDIQFSPDSGSTWSTIVSDTGNTGSCEWKVPIVPSNQALVRVRSHDSIHIADISDSVFMLDTHYIRPSYQLTAPEQGDTLYARKFFVIKWRYTGAVDDFIRLEYSTGGDWKLINDSVATMSARYPWIPNDVSNTVKVRISSIDGIDLDESEGYVIIINENASIVVDSRDQFIFKAPGFTWSSHDPISQISIFNCAGNLVKHINKSGTSFVWNGTGSDGTLARSGIYMARIQTRNKYIVKKLFMAK
ncbi:MAG: hypothetical protein HQK83_02100 [Fibrobacteria bacterium]|nr:hypothetical protein [Fibrobacteria bacterium]